MRDPFIVVVCKRCNKPVLISVFSTHMENCKNIPLPQLASAPRVPKVSLSGSQTYIQNHFNSNNNSNNNNSNNNNSGGARPPPPTPPTIVTLQPMKIDEASLANPYGVPANTTKKSNGRKDEEDKSDKKSDQKSDKNGEQKQKESDGPKVVRRKGISVLEIKKGDDEEGKVTIMVEGGWEHSLPPTSLQRGGRTNSGGIPLATRRWTRRNKLTGLSLSFKLRSTDDNEDEDSGEDEDSMGGNVSEGWSYHREKKRSMSPPDEREFDRYPKRKSSENIRNGKKKRKSRYSIWNDEDSDDEEDEDW